MPVLATVACAHCRAPVPLEFEPEPNTGYVCDPCADAYQRHVAANLARRGDIDELRATPAAGRMVSFEPLLERLGDVDLRGIDLAAIGGESGPGARPCDVAWIRSLVKRCRTFGTHAFVKQLGAHVIDRNDAGFDGGDGEWPEHIAAEDRVEHDLDGTRDGYQGAPVRIHLRDRKGGDPSEWPPDLRVRELPTVTR